MNLDILIYLEEIVALSLNTRNVKDLTLRPTALMVKSINLIFLFNFISEYFLFQKRVKWELDLKMVHWRKIR